MRRDVAHRELAEERLAERKLVSYATDEDFENGVDIVKSNF